MDLGYLRYSSALGFGGKMSPCHPFFVVRICILEWVFTPYGIKMFRYLNKSLPGMDSHGVSICWVRNHPNHPPKPSEPTCERPSRRRRSCRINAGASVAFIDLLSSPWLYLADGILFQTNGSHRTFYHIFHLPWMLKSVG